MEGYLSRSTPEDLYESVLIPALKRSETDGHRNELDPETRSFIANTTRELAEEIAAASYPGAANEMIDGDLHGRLLAEAPGHLDVLCVPARDEADDAVAMLLCQLLERQRLKSESLSITPPAEMLEQVAQLRPDTVCISALPPLPMNHTRTLRKITRAVAEDADRRVSMAFARRPAKDPWPVTPCFARQIFLDACRGAAVFLRT